MTKSAFHKILKLFYCNLLAICHLFRHVKTKHQLSEIGQKDRERTEFDQ